MFLHAYINSIIYLVYQLRENTSVTLNLLSMDPKRKVKCYNMYFINRHVFHTEEYGQGRKTYNNKVCIKGSTSNEFKVDYYNKLKDVIELEYHSKHNIVFFIYMLLVWYHWHRY